MGKWTVCKSEFRRPSFIVIKLSQSERPIEKRRLEKNGCLSIVSIEKSMKNQDLNVKSYEPRTSRWDLSLARSHD